MKHKGFSFVEVMQPCVSFNNFWEMRKEIYWIERSSDLLEAMKNCSDAKACGIFYAEEKETYEDAVWKSTF